VPAKGRGLVYGRPPSRERLSAGVGLGNHGRCRGRPRQLAITTAGNDGGEHRRPGGLVRHPPLDGYSGVRPEREEAAARCLLARDSWARAVARPILPVAAWEQEHWNIRLVPFEEGKREGRRDRRPSESVLSSMTDRVRAGHRISSTVLLGRWPRQNHLCGSGPVG
jgi:hypothetical protein